MKKDQKKIQELEQKLKNIENNVIVDTLGKKYSTLKTELSLS